MTTLTETWTAADSTTSMNADLTWTVINGVWGIDTNRAEPQTDATRHVAVASTPLATVDHDVVVDVTDVGTANGGGVIARSTNSSQDHYFGELHAAENAVRLWRTVGGAGTIIASEIPPVAGGSTHTIRMVVRNNGSSVEIEIFLDGISTLKFSDTSAQRLTTGNYVGVRTFRNSDTQKTFLDNWTGKDYVPVLQSYRTVQQWNGTGWSYRPLRYWNGTDWSYRPVGNYGTSVSGGSPSGGGGGGGGTLLTWAPPTLSNPIEVHVSGDLGTVNSTYTRSNAGLASVNSNGSNIISIPANTDVRVIFDGVVTRRLAIRGGRNVVVMAGEIDINQPWEISSASGNPRLDDRNGLYFKNQSGIVHVEGVRIHGQYPNDGIKSFSDSGQPIPTHFQIENCRIGPLYGADAGYHADGFQPVSYFHNEARFDKVTVISQFQSQMFGDAALLGVGEWRSSVHKRYNAKYNVNFDGSGSAEGIQYNLVGPGSATVGPLTFEECYAEPHATRQSGQFGSCFGTAPDPNYWDIFSDAQGSYAQYDASEGSQALTVNGIIRQGPPPGGDFCPVGVAGLSYTSPGYL